MTGNGCMYQLLPIKYELKLPSDAMLGRLQFRSRSKQCVKGCVVPRFHFAHLDFCTEFATHAWLNSFHVFSLLVFCPNSIYFRHFFLDFSAQIAH